VPIQSVTFHFQWHDFQQWFKNTIGDEELAQIMAQPSDEYLRKVLFKTVNHRITELQ
jgi:hypothetical protein